jgi:hypothetical protein
MDLSFYCTNIMAEAEDINIAASNDDDDTTTSQPFSRASPPKTLDLQSLTMAESPSPLSGTSAAEQVSLYPKGTSVCYTNAATRATTRVVIVDIHLDALMEPYYTIRFADGREKQTDNAHLRPEDEDAGSGTEGQRQAIGELDELKLRGYDWYKARMADCEDAGSGTEGQRQGIGELGELAVRGYHWYKAQMADCLMVGLGVEQDENEAQRLLLQAAGEDGSGKNK